MDVKTHKQKYLEELKRLLALALMDGSLIPRQRLGICGNMNKLLYVNQEYSRDEVNAIDVLCNELFVGWESDVLEFEADGQPKWYPIREDDSIGHWEGTNLSQRISLIKHAITNLEEMTDEDFHNIVCRYHGF